MSGFYVSGLDAISDGEIDYLDDDITVALVKDTYTFVDGHTFFDDVSSHVADAPELLAGKARSAGVHTADEVVFAAVAGIDTVIGLVVFKDTGVEATSPLICWMDRRSDTTPIEITTNGDDITVLFNGDIVYTI